MRMRIERAEVMPLEVPLARTFYGGTYSMNRCCTLLLRVWTAEGIRGQIYIGDERDQQAAVCRIVREELFPSVLGRQASEVTAIWEENFRRTTVSARRRAMVPVSQGSRDHRSRTRCGASQDAVSRARDTSVLLWMWCSAR